MQTPTRDESMTFHPKVSIDSPAIYYYYRQISEKVASMYDRKDRYYQKAKNEGFASRAVYKLLEIQKKFKIWRAGSTVLDLGCAPGGWLQILSKELGPKGKIVGIDRLPLKIHLPSNVIFIQKDFEQDLTADLEQALSGQREVDLILSDLSPDISGIAFRDTYRSYELSLKVWQVAQKFLKKNGHLVIKVFPGREVDDFKKELKKSFTRFDTFIPEATRKTSSEVYLVALGRKII
ncbi:MAG: RlmE family RNA methyltransferase [Deltaproteobacteria bacterium]|nr:RlmE family RNA methyltransferase [Deltaproteobacteria bacterium]